MIAVAQSSPQRTIRSVISADAAISRADSLALCEKSGATHPSLELNRGCQGVGLNVLLSLLDVAAEIDRIQKIVEQRRFRWNLRLHPNSLLTPNQPAS